MSMSITFEIVRQLGHGIWEASLDTLYLKKISDTFRAEGNLSIVMSNSFEEKNNGGTKVVSCKIEDLHVLNLGISSNVILINNSSLEKMRPLSLDNTNKFSDGDLQFISKLPVKIKDIGDCLLKGVRMFYKGDLKSTESNWKFVENKNFWAITIQPRVNSLLISVRGRPDSFISPHKSISLKPGRSSYSEFKLTSESQIEDALAIILEASKK